ncbi:MAG: Asp-tRNA(Asn)/Glu-tRNA(Gln) amidotransferase GatCAB subunit B, partial [Cyclobacteriaceae bacterium]
IERQIESVEKGELVGGETRLFDAVNGTTRMMRSKEALNDERYFPAPDLQPLVVSEAWIKEVESMMPPLPNDLIKKFVEEYKLPEYDAYVIADDKATALYYEEICKYTKEYKSASNWLMGAIKSYLNELTLSMEQFPLPAKQVANLIAIVKEGKVSNSVATQKLFPELVKNPEKDVFSLAEEMNLIQDSDEGGIEKLIDEVLAAYPDKVEAYKSGQKGLLGLFMGEIMKKSQGKADPKVTNQLLAMKLS